MTPAVNLVKKAKIAYKLHEYNHEVSCSNYGLEASEKLNIEADRVFKTLVVCIDKDKLAVGIIPVSATLNMKLMAKACEGKKSTMANPSDVERTTGYVLGGVSPLGQKKRHVTIVDVSSHQYGTIYVSGGRRGLEIELAPSDLLSLTAGSIAQLC